MGAADEALATERNPEDHTPGGLTPPAVSVRHPRNHGRTFCHLIDDIGIGVAAGRGWLAGTKSFRRADELAAEFVTGRTRYHDYGGYLRRWSGGADY